jgi:hypothetical protein
MDGCPLVYRCAVVIKPERAFMEWLNDIEPEEEMTLAELQKDCNLYLVPDYMEEADIEIAIAKYLELNYEQIFINELASWYLDDRLYPTLSYEKFQDWFSFSMHTMIYDTINTPIEKE